MQRMAWVEINGVALRHNLALIKQRVPHAKIMTVIKANAYGHGLVAVAKILTDADGFAVAHLNEAQALRDAGIQKPISVFQGIQTASDWQQCQQQTLWPVLYQAWQVDLVCSHASHKTAVWLKVTTGMNRLGVTPDDALVLGQKLKTHGINVRLLTHMARADEGITHGQFTSQQLAVFAQVQQSLQLEASAANSACLWDWPNSHYDWVRPGIALYGISPFLDHTATALNLHAVMTLKTRVIAINQVRAGDSVGYGDAYVCQRDMRIAVVAIGYGDGYPRHAKSGTPVLVNGQRAFLVGRVSMDLLTLDVSHLSNIQVGDEVTLWGEGLPVEQIAQNAETIAYELLCGIQDRVRTAYQNV
ncbi:MAG: alanine racemase [Gammaproteobacteria bacterium]|nr:alanine racemase [Gammaproteobacteria bacterium]